MANKWSIDFAGVLATSDEVLRNNVFVNKHGALQFYLKIISVPPENFPYNEVKTVTCYAEEIDYPDVDNEENEVREQKFIDFLEKYIFFFNIDVRTGAGSSGGIENYYIARNVSYLKKNDEFIRDEELNIIPIFTGDAEQMDKNLFESKLLNNRYVGNNKNISTDDDDTPSLICWKEPDTGDLTLYGIMDSHDYAHGGFRFKFNPSNLYRHNLNEENFFNYYEIRNVLYLPYTEFERLEKELVEKGAPMVDKQIHQESSNLLSITENTLVTDKESQFMDIFDQKCKSQDLYYVNKDLYNFHTAMKTGNLVILAGMSGTGKSKLVQCYADALDLKKEQLLFIPVRPYWQDDADVIGYLDILNNVYRPGDSGLVNILIHAYTNPDQMHIVCFDEMNIARVEHYFSQFLSVLEMDENKRVLRLYNDELQYRIYNNNVYEPTIKIGNNVLFVGTVNLDESTYQFSDKVLDRANVINLNMIPYHEKLSSPSDILNDSENKLNKVDKLEFSTTTYNSFRNKDAKVGLLQQESQCLWEIHTELQKANRNLGVGWRIAKQISNYLNNLPLNSELSREEAFDLQLVQRVLTKIRGSEEQFRELLGIYDNDNKVVSNSNLINSLNNLPQDYEMMKTRQLILDKSRELKLHGYTI
ncbi:MULTISPECIES: McrB family protein [Lysinibacillus]|uniref:McrB family protein n=1 Tax=Lysinibacillus TaxID=400634 RepID=UPI0021A93735|nr:AAA family ATPase [Lysinibacillus capsici]MCT1540259.1 AAA family ATPase [Lysinibacillus capsici]MCT1571328.1 AAA family ATPase [Lysinibacillus capsici]MCT1647882.1 AAA family ATPase [Lysinibacillus capsici]MCT1726424.1 AAA family ATPase [Lysinibacillus capsici]MCT1783528.1 AAA family ATPase [Lysinibacillus capsici]